jgi:inward rectifier potassium channel
MAIQHHNNDNNTGLSNDGTSNAGRYYNINGTPNTIKKGVPFYKKHNMYHIFINLSNVTFFIIVVLGFFAMNFIFALLYEAIGIEQLQGVRHGNGLDEFSQIFFFSCQTFTTVGYGGIHPIGFGASLLASVESLVGLLSFALITGLLYGRFSRPRSFIQFSKNALIAPYKGGKALMFRMVPYANNILNNARVTVNMAYKEFDNGKLVNRFEALELEIEKINTFLLSWTIVHPIDEKSPIYGLSIEDLQKQSTEFLVFIQAYDESFSNQVMKRHSYVPNELVVGAKFTPMFGPSEDNMKTIIDVAKLNKFDYVTIPD